MKINGHELPSLLEADLNVGGRRFAPDQLSRLKELLLGGEAPPLPFFYDLEQILDANGLWTEDHAKYYVGMPGSGERPSEIDPGRTLIIGEAEPDCFIALDYRTEPPKVVYFVQVVYKNYWRELAPTYEALIARICSSSSEAQA